MTEQRSGRARDRSLLLVVTRLSREVQRVGSAPALLGSSEIFPYHCILLKANHPESSRELFRPRAGSRDTQALLLSCLLVPASPKHSQTCSGRTGELWAVALLAPH